MIKKKESQKENINDKSYENTDNLARNLKFEPDKSSSFDIKSFESQIEKFKTLTNLIELESEMQTAYHLRNSFRLNSLAEINSDKKIGEIHLESISKKIDSKNILWNATKLLKRRLGKDGFSHYQVKKVKNLLVNMTKKRILKLLRK